MVDYSDDGSVSRSPQTVQVNSFADGLRRMQAMHRSSQASLAIDTESAPGSRDARQTFSHTEVFSWAIPPMDDDLRTLRQTSPVSLEATQQSTTTPPFNSPRSPTLHRLNFRQPAPWAASAASSHGDSVSSSPLLASIKSFPRLMQRSMSNFALGSPLDETFRVDRRIESLDRKIEALFISVDSAIVLVRPEAESDAKESLRISWDERKAKVNIESFSNRPRVRRPLR